MILLDTSAIEQSQTEESSFFFYTRRVEMQLLPYPVIRFLLTGPECFLGALRIKKEKWIDESRQLHRRERAQTVFLGAEFLSVDFPAQQEQKKKEHGITGATRYLFIQEPERWWHIDKFYIDVLLLFILHWKEEKSLNRIWLRAPTGSAPVVVGPGEWPFSSGLLYVCRSLATHIRKAQQTDV